ncbi:unnamed protein product [Linum trigynum]|uniref:Retrotransposon Copia-like N-terminal domain-containing protein n=1 Tax=Linum trigynum TaxID=586398 RepID=A0AAV2EUG6_9ROSI
MDMVAVKIDGNNFPLWEFQFRNFVKGKRLSSVLAGESKRPSVDAMKKQKEDWASSNAQVVTWLLASVDVQTMLSLRHFGTAHDMWRHICDTHSQANTSRIYELETSISSVSQGQRSQNWDFDRKIVAF